MSLLSRLSDQVEAKIARANRAFRVSSRIVATARDDLDGHGEWLDSHRVTWAEEVERQRRLLNRKLTMRALTRSVVGLVFAAPFALWRAFALQRRDRKGSSQAPRCRIIRGLDGTLCTMRPARLRPHEREFDRRQRFSSPEGNAAPHAPDRREQEPRRKRPVSVFSLVALSLIAAGAVRAILSSPTGEAPALAAKKTQTPPPLKKVRALPPLRPEASMTVAKTPRPTKRPEAISGSAFLVTSSKFEPLQMPPRTVADMALISRPLALASPEPEPAPAAEKPVAAKPEAAKPAAPKQRAKPRPKRKVAGRRQEPLPWWQQWSWMRLR